MDFLNRFYDAEKDYIRMNKMGKIKNNKNIGFLRSKIYKNYIKLY